LSPREGDFPYTKLTQKIWKRDAKGKGSKKKSLLRVYFDVSVPKEYLQFLAGGVGESLSKSLQEGGFRGGRRGGNCPGGVWRVRRINTHKPGGTV